MASMTLDVEVRIRRSWLLEAAVWTEEQVSKVYPNIGNGLLQFALRFSQVETRVGSGPWKRHGRLHLSSQCDDCDCPDGLECRCTTLEVERNDQ